MRIFLDTANAEEIRRGVKTGCLRGVTTNPTIIAREGRSLAAAIGAIVEVDPSLTILVEAVSPTAAEMAREAERLVTLAADVVVKIPMTAEGLAAVRELSGKGIRTAVTLVFSLNQAIAASCAGADFVAPFVGRLDDIDADGLSLVSSIRRTFDAHRARTAIVAASIRTPQSVGALFAAGCDVVTMPGAILDAMLKHPLTEAGLRKFEEDWKKVPSR